MKWISVKERLPKIEPGRDSSNFVLVARQLKSRPDRLIVKTAQLCKIPDGCFGGDDYMWIDYTGIVNVTYWMPLPELPEADHE